MPRDVNCWGCGLSKRFATISAMLIHLESGSCSGGWKGYHLNGLAVKAPLADEYVILDKVPWLRAGPPPRLVKDSDQGWEQHYWTCSICDKDYLRRDSLHKHLQSQECSKGYPNVLHCPVCPDEFTTLSGMFQHIETPRFPASKDTDCIARLLKKLQVSLAKPNLQKNLDEIVYRLEPDPNGGGKLAVRVMEARS